jgi:hypothetical protein
MVINISSFHLKSPPLAARSPLAAHRAVDAAASLSSHLRPVRLAGG